MRIDFINEGGKWEAEVDASLEYLRLYKERSLDGKARIGFATTFKATAAQRGNQVYAYVADQWQLSAVYVGTGPNDGVKG